MSPTVTWLCSSTHSARSRLLWSRFPPISSSVESHCTNLRARPSKYWQIDYSWHNPWDVWWSCILFFFSLSPSTISSSSPSVSPPLDISISIFPLKFLLHSYRYLFFHLFLVISLFSSISQLTYFLPRMFFPFSLLPLSVSYLFTSILWINIVLTLYSVSFSSCLILPFVHFNMSISEHLQ